MKKKYKAPAMLKSVVVKEGLLLGSGEIKNGGSTSGSGGTVIVDVKEEYIWDDIEW